MIRKELVDKLELVAPALANSALVPILQYYWFSGDTVMAFNDQIAIATPCKTPFKGAVPGTTMLDLLKASRAIDIKFEDQGDNILITAARGKFKLALLPPSEFVFEMPNGKLDKLSPETSKQFLKAIETCMRSVSADTSIPDMLGVTLVPDKDALLLFSTDDNTLSHTRTKFAKASSRVILSAKFCEQLLALAEKAKSIAWEVTDEYAMLKADDTLLFGRLIRSSHPLDYAGMLAYHLPKDMPTTVPLPKNFSAALDRAIIVTEATVRKSFTTFSVEGGVLKLHSNSDKGEVIDRLDIGKKHGDVSTKMNAKLVKSGMGDFNSILLTGDCLIMKQGDSVYLISATSGEAK